MVQSIQEWTSKICGRQSLKHAEADHLLKAAFHKPYLVHYWPKSKVAEILNVAKKCLSKAMDIIITIIIIIIIYIIIIIFIEK